MTKRTTESQKIDDNTAHPVEQQWLEDVAGNVFNASPMPMLVVDVSQIHLPIIKANQAASDLIEYPLQELHQMSFLNWVGDDSQTQLHHAILAIREGKEENVKLSCYRENGEHYWAELQLCPLQSSEPLPEFYLVMIRDITQWHHEELRLIERATHDDLTCLPNRSLLADRFEQASKVVNKQGQSVALLYLDLDNFKHVNDVFGHDMGDHLLTLVAQRLLNSVRDKDTVARIGGDEFVILLNELHAIDDGYHIAKKLHQSIEKPYAFGEQTFTVTASIGMSFFPQDGKEFSLLLKQADMAMYNAKHQGGNGFNVFSQSIHQQMQQEEIKSKLVSDFEHQEIQIYYTPIVSLDTQQVTGFDAKFHWPNMDIQESEIIDIAHEVGIQQQLMTLKLDTVTKQLQAWENLGYHGLRIIFSLNRQLMMDKQFIAQYLNQLDPLKASHIELAIDEQSLKQDYANVLNTLSILADKGVHLAIKDFGLANTDLNFLKKLPVQHISIAEYLMAHTANKDNYKAIIEAIIEIAHGLNLTVSAPALAHHWQYQWLKGLNCDFAQGLYFSESLPADAAEQYLLKLLNKTAW